MMHELKHKSKNSKGKNGKKGRPSDTADIQTNTVEPLTDDELDWDL